MTIREASAVGVEPVVLTSESTVVGLYEPEETDRAGYQSEAELEAAFIRQLQAQAYEYVTFSSETELIANLRTQLEALNDYTFTDEEWERFFAQSIRTRSGGGDEIAEKTRRIQEDHVQTLIRDNGESKNIRLIDKQHIHNNRLQVTNQYVVETGAHHTRYDVTVLVNGLPLVHIELKRRGVPIREAFNQINRYQRDSFWAGAGLFGYVQIFVISNGTQTKYYSNTTRFDHVTESTRGKRESKAANSDSFEFTSWWSDAANKPITDLVDFTRTFFAKHTLLALLTRYCVFTTAQKLLVMRPYQIAATEAILQRILTASANKQTGTVAGGGYIWHTTGSGKTLAFSLPLVQRLAQQDKARPGHPIGLVLAPTRELALQIAEVIEPLAHVVDMDVTTIFGGVSAKPQEKALKAGVDVVVACPGRLLDLMGQGLVSLDEVEITVLDEADHMADLGFLPNVRRILRATPQRGQRLLFSATLDNGVDTLVKEFLHDPLQHSVDPSTSPVDAMTHRVWMVADKTAKDGIVRRLASGEGQRILFTRTKHLARRLARKLVQAGIPAVELQGNMSQNAREPAMKAFSTGQVHVMVATDIAARGIDVSGVELVVHVDPPAEHKAYLHRSGRTARAGAAGSVITLVLPEQKHDVQVLLKKARIRADIEHIRPDDDAVSALVGQVAEAVALEDMPEGVAIKGGSPSGRASTGRPGHGHGEAGRGRSGRGAKGGRGGRSGGARGGRGGNAGQGGRSAKRRGGSGEQGAGQPSGRGGRSGGSRGRGGRGRGAKGGQGSPA